MSYHDRPEFPAYTDQTSRDTNSFWNSDHDIDSGYLEYDQDAHNLYPPVGNFGTAEQNNIAPHLDQSSYEPNTQPQACHEAVFLDQPMRTLTANGVSNHDQAANGVVRRYDHPNIYHLSSRGTFSSTESEQPYDGDQYVGAAYSTAFGIPGGQVNQGNHSMPMTTETCISRLQSESHWSPGLVHHQQMEAPLPVIDAIFPCTTSGCDHLANSPYEYKRHDSSHWKTWICMPDGTHMIGNRCAFCAETNVEHGHFHSNVKWHECQAGGSDQPAFRGRDKLVDHIRSHVGRRAENSLANGPKEQRKVMLEMWYREEHLSPIAFWCGFCQKDLGTLKSRQECVVSHFQNGATMDLWSAPKNEDGHV